MREMSDWKALLYILRFSRASRWTLIRSLLLLVIASVLGLTSAWLLTRLVSALQEKQGETALLFASLIATGEVAALVLLFIGRRGLTLSSSLSILEARQAMFEKLQLLPSSYFDRTPLGRTVTRLTHDVEQIDEFFSSSLGRAVTALLSIVIVIPAMLLTDVALGILTVGAMLPALLLTLTTKQKGRLLNRAMMRSNSEINSRLSEYMKGIHVIRHYNLNEWTKRRFDELVINAQEVTIRLNRFYAWQRPLTTLLTQGPIFVVLTVGGLRTIEGSLTLGLLLAFIRYCDRFSSPISLLAQEIQAMQSAFAAAERVAGLLNEGEEDAELGADGTLDCSTLRGEVEFREVSLSYNGDDLALAKASFHIPQGGKVGFVGRTGSGKSTSVSIIARLYPYQSGSVLIDGVPIERYQRRSLRRKIGFVSQETILFEGTLLDNLTLSGERDPTKIQHACETTGLTLLLKRRALTLESRVEDSGTNFSIGERQVIALTRTLLQQPSILILDEATASVDPYHEELLHEAVKKVMNGRTCILIAHRLSTLRECDLIVAFRGGRVVESGDPASLTESDGYYAELLAASSPTSERRLAL